MFFFLFNVKTFDWLPYQKMNPTQNIFIYAHQPAILLLLSFSVMHKKETPNDLMCAAARLNFDQDNNSERENVIYQNMLTAVMSINVTLQRSVMFQLSYTANKSAVITVH